MTDQSHRNLQRRGRNRAGQSQIRWGNTFAVPIVTDVVVKACKLPNGNDVCCTAVDGSVDEAGRGVGNGLYAPISSSDKTECTITKTYVSSPWELEQLKESVRISKIGQAELELNRDKEYGADEVDDGSHLPLQIHEQRQRALLDYIGSEAYIKHSKKMLERIKVHMSSGNAPEKIVDDDWFYLSYWKYVKKCPYTFTNVEWNEWIEPVIITSRHPFSYSSCRKVGGELVNKGVPRTDRSNVDYVLLKSGKQLQNDRKRKQTKNSHYFLDAGTSTFDSSLLWFTCAYSQRRISFDQVYGWEMTLLEPQDYWSRVPKKWIPNWHFYNTPISAEEEDSASPMRIIKSIAQKDDFVAFKLDIDAPIVEMPIARQLMNDASFSDLVDEFFFELHYRCEIMTSCGWGKRVPERAESVNYHAYWNKKDATLASERGMLLERATVSQFFIDLRKKGIRAHIWP